MGFKPEHINACFEDFEGNAGIGRYIFLPGSEGRAEKISESFSDLEIKKHPRNHNLYKGTISYKSKKIEVAAISTGMGTPSLDIIVTELIRLGAKRFLRVGTCGPLQEYMKIGDFAVGTGAVRDDGATQFYMPLEIPAISSFEMVGAAEKAALALPLKNNIYYGIIHSKATLYGREFSNDAPLRNINAGYMNMMTDAGVIASDMETSMLFILAAIKNSQLKVSKFRDIRAVKVGSINVAVTEGDKFADEKIIGKITDDLISYCISVIGEMAIGEYELL